jgi:hypothetical protein
VGLSDELGNSNWHSLLAHSVEANDIAVGTRVDIGDMQVALTLMDRQSRESTVMSMVSL